MVHLCKGQAGCKMHTGLIGHPIRHDNRNIV